MQHKRDHHIGMFDSGLGGLTVLREIERAVPNEKIIYFGDTARVPYGGKSPQTLIRYSIENSLFLMEKQIKMLVIACNTASSHAVDKLQQIFNIPVIGVIEPGAERAAQVTKNGRIAVLGTKATVNSGSYQKAIKKRLPHAEVFPIACPLLVPLVEENLVEGKWIDHPATELILKEYLKGVEGKNVDTLLLGCTHYPVLRDKIQQMCPYVTIVDTALTCAEYVSETLIRLDLHKQDQKPFPAQFFVSDDPEKFKLLGQDFLGRAIPHVEAAVLNN